jgi:hypothetical protein
MEITYKLTRTELGTVFRIGLGMAFGWSYVIAALPLIGLATLCFAVGGVTFGLIISVCMLAIVAFQFRPGTSSSRLESRGDKMVQENPVLESDRVLRLFEEGVVRRLGDITTTCSWSVIEEISEAQGLSS